jgi:hypothetical protein
MPIDTRCTHLAAALVATFALGVDAVAVAVERHEHAADEPGAPRLNHGKKWATDEPLRRGMDEIRVLMTSKLGATHKRTLTPDEYRALGTAVEQQVIGIIAQCKLAPEADAVLHVFIADVMEGAAAMQGKTKEEPGQGSHKVVAALNSYGHYFDHPGWKSVGGP